MHITYKKKIQKFNSVSMPLTNLNLSPHAASPLAPTHKTPNMGAKLRVQEQPGKE